MIGTRVGNYEIKSKLGEGGMGAVYLGEHPLIGKRVAIKVLLEDYVSNETIAARFFNEAKAANDIRHQNIVDIVDFGRIAKDGGGFIIYIVMELLEGESLAGRLDSRRLSLDEVRHILGQCCSGLAASHAKGIIHRDLKPDNLFLVKRGGDPNFLKILDFGIAKLTATAPTNAKTRTGTLIGTPAYMSPEQCAGRNKIDARSDVYSLGIVLYEMLTGQVPFKGEGFGDIVVAHLTEDPRPPSQLRPDLPPAWEAVALRAIEKDPERRFQSMEEMAAALADPEAYAASPAVVAAAARVAAAPTTAVPVVSYDPPSGAQPVPPAPAPGGTPPAPIPSSPSSPSSPSHSDAATVVASTRGKRVDTTLSSAASEVRPPATGRRRLAVVAVTAAAAMAAAIVVIRFGGGGAAAPLASPAAPVVAATATVKPPEPAAAPPVAAVLVSLTTQPPGAAVVRADDPAHVVGVTPLTMKLVKGSPGFDVQLSLDGYRVERRAISSDVNREIDVNLLQQPSAPAPGAARRQRPASRPAAPTPSASPAPAPEKIPAAPVDDDKKLVAPEL